MYQVSSLAELSRCGVSRVALAAGVFDGLHRGHQALIAALGHLAWATQAVPVVLTFSPHPDRLLTPEQAPGLLLSETHRRLLLSRYGVAATVTLPFTPELAALPPDEFLAAHVLNTGVTVTGICVGERWRFGAGGRGDTQFLEAAGVRHGFAVVAVSEQFHGEAPISATRIRAAVEAGDLAGAEAMLGRPFSILGTVLRGKGLAAARLGYPTANLDLGNEVFPPFGIYAATAVLPDERDRRWPGILYLGQAPTVVAVPAAKPVLEVHLFGFAGDLYGQELEAEFGPFIRPEVRFGSLEELRQQITLDVAAARRLHAATAVGQ